MHLRSLAQSPRPRRGGRQIGPVTTAAIHDEIEAIFSRAKLVIDKEQRRYFWVQRAPNTELVGGKKTNVRVQKEILSAKSCGLDGLIGVTKNRIAEDPFSGALFLFRNRKSTPPLKVEDHRFRHE
jgi:hypothetical protein